jgi:hypothetical protein
MADDSKVTEYRGYKIRTYRRRSKKYRDYRLSYIKRPDGTELDLVATGFAHVGETVTGHKILLRRNIAESHDKALQYITPHIDADIDDLVLAELSPDTLDGGIEWLPREQCEYIDMGPGLRKYWVKK